MDIEDIENQSQAELNDAEVPQVYPRVTSFKFKAAVPGQSSLQWAGHRFPTDFFEV
jgi:hypothetical protein